MALPFPLERLSPESFASMCVAILKKEISPGVRQVSEAGPDGGRDAVLSGPCVTQRYPWSGDWVFQFKHISDDPRRARSRLVATLRKELKSVLDSRDGRLDNYLLLASVAVTGVPVVGTFDALKAACEDLTVETGVNIDVWDGIEICQILQSHPVLALTYFGDLVARDARFLRWREQSSQPDYRSPALRASFLSPLDDDGFFWYLQSLVGDDQWVLAPRPSSRLWDLLSLSSYDDLYPEIAELAAQARLRRRSWEDLPMRRITVLWIHVALGLVAARSGRLGAAVRAAMYALRRNEQDDPEVRAWCYNVLSLVYGKLERLPLYEVATARAVDAAEEAGFGWLAATVEMRRLHKASWSASERGSPLDNSTFEAQLMAVVAQHERLYSGEDEAEHARAQRDAYLGLHYTWQPDRWDQAERAVVAAQSRFRRLHDLPELARMSSELGRLRLYGHSDRTLAIELIKEGLRRRTFLGERARARYDLLWLAEAHSEGSAFLWAEVCVFACLAIHEALYGKRDVDQEFHRRARHLLQGRPSILARRARQGRLPSGELLEWLEGATGMDPDECTRLLDPGAIRRAVVETAFAWDE